MFQKYIYILILIASTSVWGQELDKEDGETVMRRDYTFGINFNANSGSKGWGLAFDYGFQKNYKYKHLVSFTLTNIRHPKEFKIYNSNSNARGYFYGKLESLVSFRPTYGGKLVLFKMRRDDGIEISGKWSVGPSFGLLKPVYLRINKFSGSPVDEKYDPSIHNLENINSRSSWIQGLDEAILKMGVFGKFGVDFNFSAAKSNISGGEVGLMLDYFVGEPLILMHNNPGKNIFGSIYLQFNLGQKLY
jgi:hypothetical protein